jgi:hypothetical protein
VGTAWELEQKLANSTDEWGVERAQLAKVLGQLGVQPHTAQSVPGSIQKGNRRQQKERTSLHSR